MSAYYNEVDPFAAQWLRNLSAAGHIAPGEVDERSIVDVRAADLTGFSQHHFFAGIGVWSHALRLAGWPDERPVWTGSCPCQPFSGAGARGGTDDARHLWPVWYDLIRECGPCTILGEQVASPDALGWWDIVSADLERAGYPCAAIDLCAAGIGAPHIRQRLWWMAYAHGSARREGRAELSGRDSGGHAGGLGNTQDDVGRLSGGPGRLQNPQPVRACQTGGLVNAERDGRRAGRQGDNGRNDRAQLDTNGGHDWTSPLDGFWRDADWLRCTDGKWRPVEPIHVKMVDGTAPSMGRLCAYPETERENARVILQGLRNAAHTETIFQRGSGKPIDAEASQILRSSMHGEGAAQGHLFEHQPQQIEVAPANRRSVRKLRSNGLSACASCGRKPAQQCTLELEDVVRLLPQSHSLAEFYGDGRTSRALSALRSAVSKAGVVRNPSQPIQAVWASLGQEAKDRIGLGFDASRWKIVVPFPLASGVKNRVGQLRAYGNAICAPLAAQFIEAVMECAP